MSDHDVLMSSFIALKKQLEQYIDEYTPEDGPDSLIALSHAMLLAYDFPERIQIQPRKDTLCLDP